MNPHTPTPPVYRAQALAQKSQCFFLNITTSSIMSKWLGDSNKLVRAVFTLAAKLQPCIIFVGECCWSLSKCEVWCKV